MLEELRLLTVDDAKRQDLLAAATEMAIEDVAIIPTALSGQHLGHASKGLKYVGAYRRVHAWRSASTKE